MKNSQKQRFFKNSFAKNLTSWHMSRNLRKNVTIWASPKARAPNMKTIERQKSKATQKSHQQFKKQLHGHKKTRRKLRKKRRLKISTSV